ncbi:hypothetical protein WN943_025727 [Citrus x changshan-huyou]
MQKLDGAVFSKNTESVFAASTNFIFNPSSYSSNKSRLRKPPRLNFSSMYKKTNSGNINKSHQNPVLMACRASRDSNETSPARKDDSSVHGLSETIVGVLGGGQLGRMLCQAASQLAIKVMVLDPLENCPASALSYHHMVGSFDDSATVQEFAKRCGVLTVEIEHVDVATMEKLEQQGVDCQPKASTIRIIQDKYLQKVHFSRHGLPLPEFMEVNDLESARRAGKQFGYPLMVKSKRLAYDGRGNAVAKSEEELSSAITALGGFDRGLYVEKWAPFVKELAVIVVRGRDKSILCYPVVETIHKENICHIVKAPAAVPWKISELATDVAHKAVSSLEGAGIFAVELFWTNNGQILLNEVAPRPHNSGHHTIESCYTSQFEQHMRAVVGLPLGDPSMKTPAAIMYNLLGEAEGERGFYLAHQLIGKALSIPGATVHWYDKPEMRQQRKMGHITIVGSSMGLVESCLNSLLKEDSSDCQSKTIYVITGGEPVLHQYQYIWTVSLHLFKRIDDAICLGFVFDAICLGFVLTATWSMMQIASYYLLTAVLPRIGIIMGSDSDLPVMKDAAKILTMFSVPHEVRIVSAHRTPDLMFSYASSAHERGIEIIIAGAGGAAHLPGNFFFILGMVAARTPLPVIGVPVRASALDGLDSLLSIVQMPRGVPVATVAINNATNAGLLAVRMLGFGDADLRARMQQYMEDMRDDVLTKAEKLQKDGWESYLNH